MYEVMFFGEQSVQSPYQGNDWMKALQIYYKYVGFRQHVVLWEKEEPVREFYPGVGHDPGWKPCPTCGTECPSQSLDA